MYVRCGWGLKLNSPTPPEVLPALLPPLCDRLWIVEEFCPEAGEPEFRARSGDKLTRLDFARKGRWSIIKVRFVSAICSMVFKLTCFTPTAEFSGNDTPSAVRILASALPIVGQVPAPISLLA